MKINKYKCKCGVILPTAISEQEDNICPICGKELFRITEDINLFQKKLTCPKCDSYFPYDRSVQECYICRSLLTVYAPIMEEKQ